MIRCAILLTALIAAPFSDNPGRIDDIGGPLDDRADYSGLVARPYGDEPQGGSIPEFWWDPSTTPKGIAGLPRTLTLSTGSYAPAIECLPTGQDSGDEEWDCRDAAGDVATLVKGDTGATGGAVVYDVAAPTLGTGDDGAEFDADGEYFVDGADADLVDVAAGADFCQEWVVRWDDPATAWVPSDYSDGSDGWRLNLTTGADFQIQVFDSTDTDTVSGTTTTALVAGWNHVVVCYMHNNADGISFTVNGIVDATGTDTTSIDALNTDQTFALGSTAAGLLGFDGVIALFRQWSATGMFTSNVSEMDTAGQDRFAVVSATKARSGSDKVPTSTRASSGWLDKSGTLFEMGNNWPRVEDTGTAGVLTEATVDNENLQSADLDTSHTPVDAGDTVGGSLANPAGITTALAGIIGDATDGEHGFNQVITLTAVSWTASAYFQSGDQTFAYISDDTVANADAYIDLSDCTTGTVGAAATLYLETVGDWCLAGITFTGTAAAHTISYQCAAADTDNTYAGDSAAVNCYNDFRQVEIGLAPSSYIATTTTSVTRAADSGLDFDFVSPPSGVVACTVLMPDINILSGPRIAVLHTDANDYMALFGAGSDALGWFVTATSGQANVTGSTDIWDGARHTVVGHWATDDFQIFVDNASEGTPDTSGTVPAGASFFIGDDPVGTPNGGTVEECRIYPVTGETQ